MSGSIRDPRRFLPWFLESSLDRILWALSQFFEYLDDKSCLMQMQKIDDCETISSAVRKTASS